MKCFQTLPEIDQQTNGKQSMGAVLRHRNLTSALIVPVRAGKTKFLGFRLFKPPKVWKSPKFRY